MTPLAKFNAIIISITTFFMYGLWLGINKVIEIETIPFFITTILSALVSLGFYRSMSGILKKIFMNIKFVKKFVLGNYYLEGTWVGFFIGNNGRVRFLCENFEQDLEGIVIQGSSYTDCKKIHGSWIAKNPVIDIKEKRITYYYEADMIKNLFINPGLASFKMDKINKSSYINRLNGFSSDIYNPNKLFAVEEKISESFIFDVNFILQHAQEVYEKNKNIIPE